jgi:hypothetical protein
MAKATRVLSTPLADSSATHSEIIKQCTIYAQSSAAYEGGFYADTTGSSSYAGAGEMGRPYSRGARRALVKLAALSREKRPITAAELSAEARVMKLLLKTEAANNPEPEESDFFERFVKDVVRYFKQAVQS